MSSTQRQPVGTLIRDWRQRRRMSQLALAIDADISTRHLSFVETGRAKPSREMLLQLAEHLGIPLREQNVLLVAAGFAPVFAERPLSDPALGAARRAVDLVLAGHNPFPALAIDRHWTMVAANASLQPMMEGVDASLLVPPVNVLRASLHPLGLAPRIDNLGEWRGHLLSRLKRDIDVSADPALVALLEELRSYPTDFRVQADERRTVLSAQETGSVVVPLRLRTDDGVLSFISTTTIFGTPLDVTLSELAVEAFYPADQRTSERLLALR